MLVVYNCSGETAFFLLSRRFFFFLRLFSFRFYARSLSVPNLIQSFLKPTFR